MRFEIKDKVIHYSQPVITTSLEERDSFIEAFDIIIDICDSVGCNDCYFGSLCGDHSSVCGAARTLKNVFLSDMISIEG